MSKEDVARIIAQEQGLVFEAFDEGTAFALGVRVRERAVREQLGLVVDVRTFDRTLFYAAMPGTSADNANWVQRKVNTLTRLLKSSYRVVLERTFEERVFPAHRALDPAQFAIAGGAFPIRVRGYGIIGCITVSGLHERDDHQVGVEAICDELGLDKTPFMLPPL